MNCHSRESGNPVVLICSGPPLFPVFTGTGCKGVTGFLTFYEAVNHRILLYTGSTGFQDWSSFIVGRSKTSIYETIMITLPFSIFSRHRLLFIEKKIFPVLRGV